MAVVQPSLDERTLMSLAALPEQVFTRRIVIPLLQAMDPSGRVEETHGSNEAGRDVVQYTTDPVLGRPLVRCVQVKSHAVSTGSTAGFATMSSILNQVTAARRTGVCWPNANYTKADEVWVVNSHPMSDSKRRAFRELLEDMKEEGGKYIDGTEVVGLIKRHCPELLKELTNLAAPELVRIIATLSLHEESRAFGLRTDRALSDFHVAARACPSGGRALALAQGELTVENLYPIVEWECSGAEIDLMKMTGSGIEVADSERDRNLLPVIQFAKTFNIATNWKVTIEKRDTLIEFCRRYTFGTGGDEESVSVKWRVLQTKASPDTQLQARGRGVLADDLDRSDELQRMVKKFTAHPRVVAWENRPSVVLPRECDACVVRRTYAVEVEEASRRAITDIQVGLRALPEAILDAASASLVASAARGILLAERLVRQCESFGIVGRRPKATNLQVRDMQVADERLVLGIGRRILVEGPPGSGKTTLLRRLAVAELTGGRQVMFLPCSRLKREHSGMGIEELLSQFTVQGTPAGWRAMESVVLVDGLDEAPFDMGAKLEELPGETPHVVATTRLAHSTSLRSSFVRLEVVPFSDQDRDAFFAKWFRSSPERLDKIAHLVSTFGDIRDHARSPLIATLMAALVERDYAPTTRNAVYDNRLSILLETWDAVKGVSRFQAPISLRYRFLQQLAFDVHSAPGRRSTFGLPEMRDAFSLGLGRAGRAIAFDDLIDDLVVNSGVLVRDRDVYAFGHLTFQEHLVGCYLSERMSPLQVSRYLARDWWREPLLFYAGAKKDITELVLVCEAIAGRTAANRRQLREMLACAPFTQDAAMEVVSDAGYVDTRGSSSGGPRTRMRAAGNAVADAETFDDEDGGLGEGNEPDGEDEFGTNEAPSVEDEYGELDFEALDERAIRRPRE